jgi:hypothetical protein
VLTRTYGIHAPLQATTETYWYEPIHGYAYCSRAIPGGARADAPLSELSFHPGQEVMKGKYMGAFITVAQVATMLHLSPTTVRRWISEATL